MLSPNDDQKLLKNLIKGDVIAFEDIYKKYNKKVYIFSLRYLKNKEDAEGIVQEVFSKLWENCKKMHKTSNLNAWIFTVSFNAVRKRFRKLSAEKRHIERYSASIDLSKEEISQIEYLDLLNKATHLIEKLPPRQKEVFLLQKEKGLSSSEIAEELKISKKTVENHLNRARAFLKKAMYEEGLLSLLFYWLFDS
jgi:RNA polymerase sigma-70 factor (family 1)